MGRDRGQREIVTLLIISGEVGLFISWLLSILISALQFRFFQLVFPLYKGVGKGAAGRGSGRRPKNFEKIKLINKYIS